MFRLVDYLIPVSKKFMTFKVKMVNIRDVHTCMKIKERESRRTGYRIYP